MKIHNKKQMGENVELLGKMEGWIDENIDKLYRS